MTISFLLFVGCFAYIWSCPSAQPDQTESTLHLVNTAVEQAYIEVLGAEKAGANVTSLVNQLNEGVLLLSEAENAYRAGDTTTAINNAEAANSIVSQVTLSAQNLQEKAKLGTPNLWLNTALTVIGSSVFLLVLFFVWRWFKRSYITKLSKAKPEVTHQ